MAAISSMRITTEAPCGDLQQFSGTVEINGEKVEVGVNKLLLGGALLEISKSVYALALYAGGDTKLYQNKQKQVLK